MAPQPDGKLFLTWLSRYPTISTHFFFFFLWIGGGRVHLCNTYNVMCMRLSKTFIVAANICIFSRNTSDLNINCVVSRLSCSPLSNADDKKNMIWDYVKHLEHCTAYVSKFYLCSDYLDIFLMSSCDIERFREKNRLNVLRYSGLLNVEADIYFLYGIKGNNESESMT